MTDPQKATLCRALESIAALREQCASADRVDLTVLLVEGMVLVLRPSEPELMPGELCAEHGCSLWCCGAKHGQVDPPKDLYDGTR